MTNQPLIFGQHDESTLAQINRCASYHGTYSVLSADGHKGYAMPIGGCVAYRDHISVSGVGFDIGCGNKAVRTNIKATDVDVARIMDEIIAQVGFGVGRPNPTPIDHPVLDEIAHAEFKPQQAGSASCPT